MTEHAPNGRVVFRAPLPERKEPADPHYCNPSGEGDVPTPGSLWMCDTCGTVYVNKLFADWRPATWRQARKARRLARQYADSRYRQNDDGTFTGPFKGMAHGRGKPPTQPPPPARLQQKTSPAI